MNRRHHSHDDESVRRPPEQSDAAGKRHVAKPVEWQALQRALGNQTLQQLVEQQKKQRTRQQALAEQPMLIPPGMQSRISDEAGKGEPAESMHSDGAAGDIRVHEGAAAEALARDLGARAFTQGRDIFLGAAGHDQVTLAHELTHATEGTAPLSTVQRLGLEEEEEEEVVVIDDDVIDPTETMDPFAGQPADHSEPIDRTETMNPFKDEPPADTWSIDRTETMDPFKEKAAGDGAKKADAGAKAVGLEADYRATSGIGTKFADGVLTPLQEAVSFMYGGSDSAQEVYGNLERARAALLEIAKSYAGSEVLGEQIATAYNMLVAIKGWLGPYIGEQVPIETIQKQLEGTAAAFEGLMKRLDVQGTVE